MTPTERITEKTGSEFSDSEMRKNRKKTRASKQARTQMLGS
jgi:hypothetical protein